VLSTAEAWIEDSAIDTTDGDLTVEGLNSAHIVARTTSAMTSDGKSIGATLAFNTVGWEAQNVLFSAIDALVGSQIGDEQPAQMRAYIKNSDINAAGNVTVDAQSEAYINAFLSNETRSEMATALGVPDSTDTSSAAASASSAASSAASPQAKGLALGFVLTSNMVSSRAESFIIGEGREVNTEDGSLTVTASDDARVISKINLESVADGEESETSLALKALVNYVGITYTDRSGEQKLKIGDRVRVADADYDSNDRVDTLTAGDRVELKASVGGGEAGDLYEYLGDDEEDIRLDQQDYADTTLWKRIQGEGGQTYIFKGSSGESELADEDYSDSDRWFLIDVGGLADVGYAVAGEIGAAKVGASAFGGLVVRNDARSDVKSYIEDQTLAITGDITVTATEAATIAALDTSTVAAADLGSYYFVGYFGMSASGATAQIGQSSVTSAA
jgi:translation initiation factor 6 (eIF-6)